MVLASVMVCGLPKYFGGRLILSGYHGVWEATEKLPDDIKSYFTDDVGNKDVSYGGLLQMVHKKAFDKISNLELFVCFRGVHEEYLELVQTRPPKEFYESLKDELVLIGWDISTGNGWCSASSEGLYPLDPFTGEILDENIKQLNEYGLFGALENCLEYCRLNNEEIPDNSPWYPVAIYIDKESSKRLQAYLKEQSSSISKMR